MNKQIEHIKQLLKKYFEGSTSLEEEQALRDYFKQESIDESLKSYQPLFEFFREEREMHTTLPVTKATESRNRNQRKMTLPEQPKKRFLPIFRTGIAAAASIILLLSVKALFFDRPKNQIVESSMVYIDGKKFTDLKTIQTQALQTLEDISETNDEVIESQIDLLESFNDF